MVLALRSCCLFFSLRKGSFVLGCVGVVASVLAIVPSVLILEDHDFYIDEFVKQQRMLGVRDIDEADVPAMAAFSRITWTSCVAFAAAYALACVLLMAGVATENRYFLVPWLTLTFVGIAFGLIMVLATMVGLGSQMAFFTFLVAAPFLSMSVYFWFSVYSAFHSMSPSVASLRSSTACLLRAGSSSSAAHIKKDPHEPIFVGGSVSTPAEHPSTFTIVSTAGEVASASASAFSSSSFDSDESVFLLPPAMDASRRSSSSSASAASSASKDRSKKSKTGLTPPPPYESVAMDIGQEEVALASGVEEDRLIFAVETEAAVETKASTPVEAVVEAVAEAVADSPRFTCTVDLHEDEARRHDDSDLAQIESKQSNESVA